VKSSGRTTPSGVRSLAARALGLLAAPLLLAAAPATAARLGLAPLMGDGVPGRTTLIAGTEFLPSTTFTVTFRGTATTPATVTSDAAGAIAPVTVVLPALPAGGQDVVLTGGSRTYTFTSAYQVARNIGLSPAQGDGRAGMTSYDPAAGALSGLTGAWTGMVLVVEGWGFSATGAVAANSITVGGAATHHPAVAISATGRFPSTTLIVQSNLNGGRKDLVINDGAGTVFPGVYTVRRRIGSYPDRGINVPGGSSTIFIEGFGFDDIALPANSITVNTATTWHPSVTPVNGAFSLTLTIAGVPAANAGSVVAQGETFTFGYDAVANNKAMIGLSPSTFEGMPNMAFQVEGMGNLVAGAVGANSMVMQDSKADSATVHPGFTIAGGRFPRMWVMATLPQEAGTTAVSVFDSLGGRTNARGVEIKGSAFVSPVFGSGRPGFTISVTGFGFHSGATVAANTITVGGLATTHPGLTASGRGDLPIVALAAPAMPFGDRDLVITDSFPLTRTFALAFHDVRTIGLSYVNGSGAAGELAALTGNGFGAGVIGANSLQLPGAVTHPAVTPGADGSVAATPITLAALGAGAYSLTLPASQTGTVFASVYRVTPMLSLAKYVAPPAALSGTVATFTFSYTNAGVGDWVKNLSILDTVPAGMQYAPGSAASSLPATIDWFSSVCTCFTAVEPAPANVVAVRWTLAGLLPSGASGQASFKVNIQ